MYLRSNRPPLARRAGAVGLVLAVHAVAIAGFLQVRVRAGSEPDQVAVQVSFVDGPQDESTAPVRPTVRLADVKPFVPNVPRVDLPIVVQTAAPTAITVSAPPEPLPAASVSRSSIVAPVAVASVDYLRPPAPRYPPKARRARVEGTVLLRVVIDTQGNASEVQVHRSSGHDELDAAARSAVLAAAFRPYVENGVARPAQVIVPIEFALTLRTASR